MKYIFTKTYILKPHFQAQFSTICITLKKMKKIPKISLYEYQDRLSLLFVVLCCLVWYHNYLAEGWHQKLGHNKMAVREELFAVALETSRQI